MFSSPNSSNQIANFFTSSSSSSSRYQNKTIMSCKATTDYYKLLSVRGGRDASGDEIKRAYRAKALQYHPDVVCDPILKEQSTRMFVQLNAAYKTLSDPVLRREYDYDLVMMGNNLIANNNYCLGRRGFDDEVDRTVWQRQILELQRRSGLRRDRRSSWGGRMRARNDWSSSYPQV